MSLARATWDLCYETVNEWINDRASRKGAALAFYTVFSLAPILILSIAIAGIFFGQEAARGEIFGQVKGLLGADAASAVQAMIQSGSRPGAGLIATVLGIVTLCVGATTALAELKDGLDQIWGAPSEKTSGFWYFIRKRLLSVGLIASLGFLLLVSLVFSALVSALARSWGPADATGMVLQSVNFLFSFALVTLLFAMIYKILRQFASHGAMSSSVRSSRRFCSAWANFSLACIWATAPSRRVTARRGRSSWCWSGCITRHRSSCWGPSSPRFTPTGTAPDAGCRSLPAPDRAEDRPAACCPVTGCGETCTVRHQTLPPRTGRPSQFSS